VISLFAHDREMRQWSQCTSCDRRWRRRATWRQVLCQATVR